MKKLAEQVSIPEVSRFFHFGEDPNTRVLGVPFGKIFAAAKQFADMQLPVVEKLLSSVNCAVGMGAVSIMDFQVRQTRARRNSEENWIRAARKRDQARNRSNTPRPWLPTGPTSHPS